MKHVKHWIEFLDDWRDVPMAYWVHVEQDGKHWRGATEFVPPAPVKLAGKGYPVICIEFEDEVLRYSSFEQLQECIRILSQNPMPTTRMLSAKRPGISGPNTHWLSRFPSKFKSPKTRQRIITVLEQVMCAVTPFNTSLDTHATRESAQRYKLEGDEYGV